MKIIENELKTFNEYLINSLSDDKNHIANDITEYLSGKSKRLRPSFVFLFAKALGLEITKKIYHLACSVELVHNSTLVHDDILDNADTRRGKISLNYKLGNSLSVLAGDVLLSVALKELVKCENIEVVNNYAESLYLMCKGEINQNFTIDKLPTMEEYIRKSEYKTAELFKAPLTSLATMSNIEEKEKIHSFAKNFGIAFQIKDDLLNILKTDKSKPIMSDIHNGIYTAPVIYLNENKGNVENMSKEEIIENLLSDKKYIEKTTDLIKEYADRAIEDIAFIKDNEYKKEIIKLTENLYKVGINE
ncbi:MAG: polyprenyl synthetase family protein [Candidatus Gastranaerophilales bacterium]|nr:polyprenyl synthetase family protein [Candidatus Gastranaerophilales bacterium]